jgi:hypothetical protein
MDDEMKPLDERNAPEADALNEQDTPTEPLPVVRHRGPAPNRGARRAEVPPLPPTSSRWPPRGANGNPPEWPGPSAGRLAILERALQAARERQLSLGCGTVAAIMLLGAFVLAALGGGFAGFGNMPLVPRPGIQAAPRPTVTPLPTPTVTPFPTATPSPIPTVTPSPSPTQPPSPTVEPSPTPASSPTPGASPTGTPSPTEVPPQATPSEPGD